MEMRIKWLVTAVNGCKYRAVVAGNQLVLEKIPKGTMIMFR